jgi:hypothetical protein
VELESWVGQFFWPALLGAGSAFAYLAVLARAHLRTRALVALYVDCVARRLKEERFQRQLGFSPRLAPIRRLEAALRERLRRDGL